MTALPFELRSAITRATFHAQEGDRTAVPTLAAEIEDRLSALDPADADVLAPQIGAAVHEVRMLPPSPNPIKRLMFARRRAARARVLAEARQTLIGLPAKEPRLAWVLMHHPDPDIAKAARKALPDPPSPFHAAMEATPCTSD